MHDLQNKLNLSNEQSSPNTSSKVVSRTQATIIVQVRSLPHDKPP